MGTFVNFQHVKANAGFAPVLAHYGIALTGKGSQKAILCPFHKEKTASCKVNLDKKIFHCFGCGAKGNVLDFVAKKEGTDLRSAALLLSDWCGIDPAPDDHREPRAKPAAKARKSAQATSFVPATNEEPEAVGANDNEPPAASPVSAQTESPRPLSFALKLDPSHPYLRERGLSDEDVETFGLGYCSRGVMRGRIAIPIHDEHGNLVAYAGRWPGDPPEDEPKYRLPDGFEKSRVLFNLHRVPSGTMEVVVVEGFFGAIAIHQLGLPVVACMGSSMSDEQFTLLASRGVNCLKLLFDADPAGEEASKKLAGEATRRFYVRRVLLPQGHQPDTAVAEAVLSDERPPWLQELFAPPP